ncbi:MAG: thiamine-phosphate kinase [Brevinematia bacterium]
MKLEEFELIEVIKNITEKNVPGNVLVPNGDDCFVFKENQSILITTDSLVDGVHFKKELFPPYDLGIKSASANLSDIAAMGGIPKFAIISLILPTKTKENWVTELYKGLTRTFSKYDVYIGGGNLSKGNTLSITITLIGISNDKVLTRKGAKPGNLIFVSGTLGDSALGLKLIMEKREEHKESEELIKFRKYLIRRHLNPTPRIELGKRIVNIATSCIDISDGLLQDLNHILKSSKVGAKIKLENIPISPGYNHLVEEFLKKGKDNYLNRLKYALTGGEDYELIFTVPNDRKDEIQKISKELKLKITEIGQITEGSQIEIYSNNKKIKKNFFKGWQHF